MGLNLGILFSSRYSGLLPLPQAILTGRQSWASWTDFHLLKSSVQNLKYYHKIVLFRASCMPSTNILLMIDSLDLMFSFWWMISDLLFMNSLSESSPFSSNYSGNSLIYVFLPGMWVSLLFSLSSLAWNRKPSFSSGIVTECLKLSCSSL